MTPAPVVAAPPPVLDRRRRDVIFGTIMLGVLLAALDQTIVGTALPTIVADLGGGDHMSWVDDESGAARQHQSAGWAVAGGILLELVMAERVSVSGRYLELRDTTPTGEQLLDGRILLIEAWLRGRDRRRVTDWLTKDNTKAFGAALESLGERGLVVAQVHKVLGMFPQRRYPEADGAVERALRERLRAAVLDGTEPDERTAGLIALLHAAKLHRLAFPDRRHDSVAPRMAEIAAGQWAAQSVRAAIRDMQAAMVAVMAVTVLTATS